MTIIKCITDEIEIMPETDENTLCVTLKDIVSAECYSQYVLKPFREMAKNGQKYNLLINYDRTFKGWSPEAAKLNFQTIIDYGSQSRRLAYVNAPDSKRLQIKMVKPLFTGEIRFFETGELQEALRWVKA